MSMTRRVPSNPLPSKLWAAAVISVLIEVYQAVEIYGRATALAKAAASFASAISVQSNRVL